MVLKVASRTMWLRGEGMVNFAGPFTLEGEEGEGWQGPGRAVL